MKWHSRTRTSRNRRSRTKRTLQLEPLEGRQLLAADLVSIDGLSDEFDDSATLASWQRVYQSENWGADQLQTFDVDQTQPGRLVMQPHSTTWYQDWRGPMAFKEVTGDFVFTTEVTITDRDDVGGSDADDVPGDATFSLGGLMIRTPRAIEDPAIDWQPGSMVDDGSNQGENYVFLSLGHGVDGQFSFEVKTTRNSNSQLELTPLGQTQNTAELRLARVGDAVIALYRLPGESWSVHRRYSRPDMPATLQLGMVTYSDWNKAGDFDPFFQNSNVLQPGVNDPSPAEPFNPDLTAGFEYVRFTRPELPQALENVDLVQSATDDQLLGFLGEALEGTPEPSPSPEPAPTPEPLGVGMNLVNVTDWSRAWIFRDAFKMSRPWASRELNLTTYEQPYAGELSLDESGWVRELDQRVDEDGNLIQQVAQTYLFSEGGNPAGAYRAEWSGQGDMTFGAVVTDQGQTPEGRSYAILDVAADQPLVVTIRQTDPQDYIRDIQLFMPDYQGQSLQMPNWQPGAEQSPFHPLFLERLQPFETIRFMQWQEVNQDDRAVVTPGDLRPFDHATQATYGGQGGVLGASVEYMVQLVNELQADPWFNMPHSADDDYVRTYAEYVRDTLNPDARVYVEWSNEIWNAAYGFNAYGWVEQQRTLPENAGLDFFDVWAQEARRDFAIWTDVFAGQEERLVRVAAGQQNNPWLTGQLLARMEGEFDAVSATSYAGLEAEHFDWADETTTEDDIIDFVLENAVPWSLSTQSAHVDLAESYSQSLDREIPFISYEGGSHLTAYGTEFADLVQSASDHPRMREVYQSLLHGMDSLGVDLHMQYVFTGRGEPSPWGEFAVLREMDMPLSDAHEYVALTDFLSNELPAPVATVSIEATDPDAHEWGDAAEFTITRSGGLSMDDLTVTFEVGGSATAGIDYEPLGTSIVIPAGQAAVTLPLNPLLDSLVSADEGTENVTLQLVAGDGYAVHSTAFVAEATIHDNLFPTVGDQVMSRGDDSLVISLPVELAGQPATYEALIIENLAAELHQQHQFLAFQDDFAQNWGGFEEKWLLGNEGYYYLMPSAELFLWEGDLDSSTLLAALPDAYYDDPNLLVDASTVAADVQVAAGQMTIDPASDFAGAFTVRLQTMAGGIESVQTFQVQVMNGAPQIAPIDDQVLLVGGEVRWIELDAVDPDGDPLAFEVRVTSSLADQIMAEHNLHTIPGVDDYAENWGGFQERWLQGDLGWYFLMPEGALYRWGGSFETSTQLAVFPTAVYEDPQILLSTTAPEVGVEVIDGQLRLNSGDQSGVFHVEVIASDGFESAQATFALEVANTPPTLELTDQTLAAGESLTIPLPATDTDGHAVTYQVEVLGGPLHRLQAEHGFQSSGNYFENYFGQQERWIQDGDAWWHYLLPDGSLYRWGGSFADSTLVAEVGTAVYDDPTLLTDPPSPPVVAEIIEGALVITASEDFQANEISLRVTASDGYAEVSTEFNLLAAEDETAAADAVFAQW